MSRKTISMSRMMSRNVIIYDTPSWLTAFTTGKGSGVEDVGLRLEDLALPRQTHSDHVLFVTEAGRPEDTDAVITDKPGLCVCVKTADCIPVLLYDSRQRVVAAVHAGWRGTVSRIVQKTIEQMHPVSPTDLHAIIGPGISLEWFEVGDEVYEAFTDAGYPMQQISQKQEKWHIDLTKCCRLQLEATGIKPENIEESGICTYDDVEDFFSARRLGTASGRILTGIILR